MNVLNVHERELQATAEQVGALIDSLASREDPAQSIKFRFTGPKGFEGFHGYEVLQPAREEKP